MKLVREYIDFERGTEPKKAMNVGRMSTSPTILSGDYYKAGNKLPLIWREVREIFKDPTKSEHLEADYGFHVLFPGEKEARYFFLEDLISNGGTFIFGDELYDFSNLVKENLEFERGKNPKETLGIGLPAETIITDPSLDLTGIATFFS